VIIGHLPSLPVLASRSQNRPRLDCGVESGKLKAIEVMLERGQTPQLKGPSPTQRELLEARLSRVDRGLLRWAQAQGVRLQVLQSGESLEATQALRDLTGQFEERLKPETVEAIHRHLAPLSERIKAESDPERALSLRRQKRNEMAELLTHNPCGGAVFTPAFAPILAPATSRLAADPGETPTLKAMALDHGASTTEEQANFYGWMEKLNGERLQQARQATIEERSRLLASRPEALHAWLQQARQHPELVPLDVTVHTLVVPDAHFLSAEGSQRPMLLDRSDVVSVEGWRNGDFRGQWFFLEGKTHLLIRDSALELDTPIHELGHVIDMTLEKQEPEFYGAIRPRIEKAHYQARLNSSAISSYALANRREYIAEGFAAYYEEPARLRKVDPALYQLVDEMVEFCCGKAGADRVLDQKLQKIWSEATALAGGERPGATALRAQFAEQLSSRPSARALSQSAMASALQASQLGLLVGTAEAALGPLPPPNETLAEAVQQAYASGVDESTSRKLFQLGYQSARSLVQNSFSPVQNSFSPPC